MTRSVSPLKYAIRSYCFCDLDNSNCWYSWPVLYHQWNMPSDLLVSVIKTMATVDVVDHQFCITIRSSCLHSSDNGNCYQHVLSFRSPCLCSSGNGNCWCCWWPFLYHHQIPISPFIRQRWLYQQWNIPSDPSPPPPLVSVLQRMVTVDVVDDHSCITSEIWHQIPMSPWFRQWWSPKSMWPKARSGLGHGVAVTMWAWRLWQSIESWGNETAWRWWSAVPWRACSTRSAPTWHRPSTLQCWVTTSTPTWTASPRRLARARMM